MRLEDIDLTNLDLFATGDVMGAFKTMRDQAPVYWHERKPGHGFWSVTRFQDVLDVYHDAPAFSSHRGVSLQFSEDLPEADQQQSFGMILIQSDPPRHGKVRQIVNRRFTPRAVMPAEPHIRRIANDIIDSVIEKGECDFVVDIAARLPTAVTCEMMGIPPDKWDLMFQVANTSIGSQDPEYQEGRSAAEANAAASALGLSYLSEMVEKRRKNPGDDLISAFTFGEVDGQPLSDMEILLNSFLLIVAGQETTRNATSGGVLALIEHPAEAARLHADSSLYPVAIEEFLRWSTPITHLMRTATRDIEFRGHKIAKRHRVVLWNLSANRDERQFPEPDKFKIDRAPNDHISFGHGEHFCLGANLARLELTVMVEEVTRRMAQLELAGPVQKLRSNFVAGIKHMPIRFKPGRPQTRPAAA